MRRRPWYATARAARYAAPLACVLALSVTAGCDSGGEAGKGTEASRPAGTGTGGCRPAASFHPYRGDSVELRAVGTGGLRVGGLVIDGNRTVASGPATFTTREVHKIVWRVTGKGPLHLTLTGPDGRTRRPERLEPHGDSSYRRPGDEWGSGLRFPTPGCWHIRLTRTTGSADIPVTAVRRPAVA
ncbi:hypothetical protein ADK86_00690 [Streptomyces sp. NRRL F-5755]|uniref:hypothetical protein n=1 Tax=Streptomyces sp. NRRL F-5755 TaxID=1519475 RepID=UPI0006AEBCC3|nr:hypothetical protein [Streptomyces sp. NRRL F-5755]KOU09471.1 hypothetical protein ADK86_00690 [Streptomyces sp. NRRL F-5755]